MANRNKKKQIGTNSMDTSQRLQMDNKMAPTGGGVSQSYESQNSANQIQSPHPPQFQQQFRTGWSDNHNQSQSQQNRQNQHGNNHYGNNISDKSGNCQSNFNQSADQICIQGSFNPDTVYSNQQQPINNNVCTNQPRDQQQQYNGQNNYNGNNGYSSSNSNQRFNTQGMDNTNVLMDMITQMNNNFSSRLSVIENSLSKLGKIENDITRVRADVENIKSDNSNFNQRLMDVEIFCQTNSDSFDEFNKKTDTNSENITNLKDENRYLSLQLSEIRHSYANLKEEFLELKTRNMQENLLFFGIPEEVEQSWPNGASNTDDRSSKQVPENTEDRLRQFMANELQLETPDVASNIKFDRVHRIGVRKRNGNPRPIVAKFERYSDREVIRQAGMELNSNPSSKYRVREQFPKEIEDRRKLLYPFMYRFKRANPNNRVNLVRDKLYLNGRLYDPDTEPGYNPHVSQASQEFQRRQSHSQPRTTSLFNRQQPNLQRYESQGAIPKRNRNNIGQHLLSKTPIPTSNRFSSLSDENDFTDRQPGRKHKNISPLSDQASPKKQKDTEVLTFSDSQSANASVSDMCRDSSSPKIPTSENIEKIHVVGNHEIAETSQSQTMKNVTRDILTDKNITSTISGILQETRENTDILAVHESMDSQCGSAENV